VRALTGSIKFYAWGSPVLIPELLGRAPDGRPWAELWFGTHPLGPSSLADDGTPLAAVTGTLEFLAKFLAAGAPLSLQVHPTAEQAEQGFERENAAGIPLDAPNRTYRDPFAKPEVIIAASRFRGLCGFRPEAEAVAELRACGAVTLAERVEQDGYSAAVRWVLAERPALHPRHPRFEALDRAYPGDPGALVALLLNEVVLEPGDAMFLPAGQLHMYVEGLGVEVMGASDNVVRGGLTPKHIDIAELARVLDSAPRRPEVLRPAADGWYPIPTKVFAVQELRGECEWTATGPELVLVLEGDGRLAAGAAAVVFDTERGSIGAGGLAYRVSRARAC
jgi:mannose-6-phosphate isomerase